MATTTNYAWETPDDTDLVKDGAAAIRTLGSSIDTTTKALNPSTTLGDIEYRSSTANTNTRLGIGTTGQVLTVAGGVPSWATPGGASLGLSLISSGSLSGTQMTFSGLTQDTLILFWQGGQTSAASADVQITLNNDTGTDYTQFYVAQDDSLNLNPAGTPQTYIYNPGAKSNKIGYLKIINGKSSTTKKQISYLMGSLSSQYQQGYATYDGAAVTSLELKLSGGSWNAGTFELWGA